MKIFDVVVVGGGLVGTTFALDLAKSNPRLEIALLEPYPVKLPDLANGFDTKIYALSVHNLQYLSEIGGLPNEQRMGVIQKMAIFGDGTGSLLLDAKSVNQFFLAKTVESSYLLQHLYKQLEDLVNVHFIYGQVDNISINEINAEILCGDITYTTQLIIGADGASSVVRKYAGVSTQITQYPQEGLVANFACELPHKNTAYQWFNSGNTLAYLPLPNNQISIVWSHSHCTELAKLSDKELCNKVAATSQYELGELKLITPAAVFPLRLSVVKKLYAKRIALIGDAAHTIHPLAGQGVNLGFADARLLAGVLAHKQQYQLGDESLLAKYNARRQLLIWQMQLGCHGLYTLFDTQKIAIAYLRNLGLNLVNKHPAIKKYLINSAIRY